jgi:hypothetical protein
MPQTGKSCGSFLMLHIVQGFIFVSDLSIAAVAECPGRCRVSVPSTALMCEMKTVRLCIFKSYTNALCCYMLQVLYVKEHIRVQIV